VPQPTVSV